MALADRVQKLRELRMKQRGYVIPESYQGVTKAKIEEVLERIGRNTRDEVDVVFALLDDESDSWIPKAPKGSRFSHGATVAHIGSHVAMLQRQSTIKLDREGRDYWIKPLRQIGAIEPVYPVDDKRRFMVGHPVPKSSKCAYRLADSFVKILKAQDGDWQQLLTLWNDESAKRQRLAFQAELARETAKLVKTDHKDLIELCVRHYAPRFLPGYEVLFTDAEDGDRVTEEERTRLLEAGLEVTTADAMPDVLLWNRDTNALWVIEAVTSDGEVDDHKVDQSLALANRAGIDSVGFTTAFQTWTDAARRQTKHKNIAVGTYLWIASDASKHFRLEESGPKPIQRVEHRP